MLAIFLRREFSIDVALHDIDNVIGVRMRENIIVGLSRRVLAEARLGVRNPYQDRRLHLPLARQFVGDQVETPTTVAEAAMRVIPDVLAIVTVEHREAPAMIVLREFGKIDVNRAGCEMTETRQYLRFVYDVEAGGLGQPDHVRFGNNGAICPIFVPGARRPHTISSESTRSF